jgi:hypothetical protein
MSDHEVPGYIHLATDRLERLRLSGTHRCGGQPKERRTPEEKLTEALDLMDVAVRLYEERMRREHPDESDRSIAARVSQWLRTHEGAPHGDGPGKPVSEERLRRLRIEDPS